MMGNGDEACSLDQINDINSTNGASPEPTSGSCKFLTCGSKEKPIYLEMPNDADVDDISGQIDEKTLKGEESSHGGGEYYESMKGDDGRVKCEIWVKYECEGNWMVQWNVPGKDGDFIGLCEVGKYFLTNYYIFTSVPSFS